MNKSVPSIFVSIGSKQFVFLEKFIQVRYCLCEIGLAWQSSVDSFYYFKKLSFCDLHFVLAVLRISLGWSTPNFRVCVFLLLYSFEIVFFLWHPSACCHFLVRPFPHRCFSCCRRRLFLIWQQRSVVMIFWLWQAVAFFFLVRVFNLFLLISQLFCLFSSCLRTLFASFATTALFILRFCVSSCWKRLISKTFSHHKTEAKHVKLSPVLLSFLLFILFLFWTRCTNWTLVRSFPSCPVPWPVHFNQSTFLSVIASSCVRSRLLGDTLLNHSPPPCLSFGCLLQAFFDVFSLPGHPFVTFSKSAFRPLTPVSLCPDFNTVFVLLLFRTSISSRSCLLFNGSDFFHFKQQSLDFQILFKVVFKFQPNFFEFVHQNAFFVLLFNASHQVSVDLICLPIKRCLSIFKLSFNRRITHHDVNTLGRLNALFQTVNQSINHSNHFRSPVC